MAVRSGAGTGVIVSLVVFIILTISMLALSIAFYTGQNKATESEATATAALTDYVTSQQQSTDKFKAYEQAAASARTSVSGHLADRYDALATYVIAGNAKTIEEIKADLSSLGVAEDGSIRDSLLDSQRRVRTQEAELESKNAREQDLRSELSEKDAQIARMKDDHDTQIDTVTAEISAYRQQADDYRRQVQDAIDRMNGAIDSLRDDYEDRIADIEDEKDNQGQELVLARARLDEYEAILDEIRIKAQRPELLVDAEIIDVDPANDQVFINRGRDHRIVLGMTFEAYDDASSIRPDRNGMLPRGKASIQVTKVGPTTSTCKVTRSVTGRPVVRNDVVANAVYDPDRRFKFLVHGKFDVDLDGRPTEQEADHLRSLIIKWGGEVVLGDELPGDLDFLVLGEMPPMPRPLPNSPSNMQIEIWAEQRAARLQYQELFERASEAQIPVLNSNRFFILIGHTG